MDTQGNIIVYGSLTLIVAGFCVGWYLGDTTLGICLRFLSGFLFIALIGFGIFLLNAMNTDI